MDITDLVRCAEDKVYFFEKCCKIVCPNNGSVDITLYEYQKDIINESHIQAETSRQVGFTTLAVLNAFHDIIFKSDQTIAFVAPTYREASHFRDLLLFLYSNTTFPKMYLPTIKTNNKHSTEFDNGNRILYTPMSCSHIRGWSINSMYIQEVDYTTEQNYEEYMHSIAPIMLSIKGTKFWIWSCVQNGNIKKELYSKLKRIKLPFWVTDNKSYLRYKELVRILGEEQAMVELGIT